MFLDSVPWERSTFQCVCGISEEQEEDLFFKSYQRLAVEVFH